MSKPLSLLPLLLLTGCFSFGGGSSAPPIVFESNGSSWELSLPATWKETSSASFSKNTVLVAQNLSQNVILEKQNQYHPKIADQLLQDQESLFHYFVPLSQEANQWSFQAKSKPDRPLRTYYQKALPITQSPNYFLLSCSHEAALEASDCEGILSSWQEQAKE